MPAAAATRGPARSNGSSNGNGTEASSRKKKDKTEVSARFGLSGVHLAGICLPWHMLISHTSPFRNLSHEQTNNAPHFAFTVVHGVACAL